MWPLTLVQISAIPAHLEESHESGVFFVPSFPAVRQIAAHVMALRKRCGHSSVSKNVRAISVPTPLICFSNAAWGDSRESAEFASDVQKYGRCSASAERSAVGFVCTTVTASWWAAQPWDQMLHMFFLWRIFSRRSARRLMFSEFFCHCLGGVADSSQVSATVMRRVLLLL